MSVDVSVKVYGCRGSIPVAGSDYAKYGGHTSCAVVRVGDREIVFDAGSGIRTYSQVLNGTHAPKCHIFFSHAHFDHVLGLPYFTAIYRPDATIHFWGPRDGRFDSWEGTIDALLRPPYHPVSMWEMLSKKYFHDIGEADVVYFLEDSDEVLQLRPAHPDDAPRVPPPEQVAFSVHCMRGYNHPKSGVNIYKVVVGDRSIVYATDTEGYVGADRRLLMFARGADVLMHDAMYTEARYTSMPVPTQGYGHSTVEIATSLAKQAGVKQLVLWHHDPDNTDDELDAVADLARSLFPDTILGHDGLEIHI